MGAGLVIVNADLGAGRVAQIRVEERGEGDAVHRVITEVADRVAGPGDDVLDAAGGAVLAGFTDHHLHLFALAVAESSVRCGPPDVVDRGGLRAALTSATPDDAGWVRGVGYIESVAGELTRDRLDDLEARRPVRVSHRSGAMWMLNSAATSACGLDTAEHPGIERDEAGRATGRLWRADAWLRTRLPGSGPPALGTVGKRLRDLGIVEMTDATPDLDAAAISGIVDAVDTGEVSGRVQLLGVPLGFSLQHPRISVGPYKIVIADSDLPSLDDLVDRIAAAHANGRAVAVHCVSRVAYALLTAAWEIAGVRAGDRIEHAGLLAPEAAGTLAANKITVVTQPGFLPDRGDDFLDDSDTSDHDDLYRCGSLIRAGVSVALSSDAPYGPLDPWTTVSAATRRRTQTGRVVGPAERIDTVTALRLHRTPAADPAGTPRRVAVGEPGDLIVVDRPLAEVHAEPADVGVVANLAARG